jgi:hypothetical protein
MHLITYPFDPSIGHEVLGPWFLLKAVNSTFSSLKPLIKSSRVSSGTTLLILDIYGATTGAFGASIGPTSAACRNNSASLGSKRRLSANGSWFYFFSNSQSSSFGSMSFPGCCSTQSRKDLLVTLAESSSKYSSLSLSSNLVHEVTKPRISCTLIWIS